MAAPSKPFIPISDGQIDPNSPTDQLLMTSIRDALIHLEEWLGDSFVAAIDHDHDNVNSASVILGSGVVTQDKIDAAAVGQAELKTASSTVGTGSSGNFVLPGGEWGFYPQVKATAGLLTAHIVGARSTVGFTTLIFLSTTSGTVSAQQRHIQASPPHKIGSVGWGHFLFLLRNSMTGEVISSYESEDPPWANNGPSHLVKDSMERIQAVPHPFADYFDKDPSTDGLEIVLVDLCEYDVKKWKADNAKVGKSILEDLAGKVNPGQERAHTDFGLPTIPGFTDKVKIRVRM